MRLMSREMLAIVSVLNRRRGCLRDAGKGKVRAGEARMKSEKRMVVGCMVTVLCK